MDLTYKIKLLHESIIANNAQSKVFRNHNINSEGLKT